MTDEYREDDSEDALLQGIIQEHLPEDHRDLSQNQFCLLWHVKFPNEELLGEISSENENLIEYTGPFVDYTQYDPQVTIRNVFLTGLAVASFVVSSIGTAIALKEYLDNNEETAFVVVLNSDGEPATLHTSASEGYHSIHELEARQIAYGQELFKRIPDEVEREEWTESELHRFLDKSFTQKQSIFIEYLIENLGKWVSKSQIHSEMENSGLDVNDNTISGVQTSIMNKFESEKFPFWDSAYSRENEQQMYRIRPLYESVFRQYR